MVIQSDLHEARKVEQVVLLAAEEQGYSEACRFALKLALEEGLNNAIKHGNGGDSSKTIDIRYNVDSARVTITITDQGRGFNLNAVPDPTADENLEKPSGRGIMLMRAYMDELRFNPAGNQVCMVKLNR